MSSRLPDPTFGESLTDETCAEHRETMQAVTALERCLDLGPGSGGRWVADLLEELARTIAVLRAHFVTEAQGPLFRQVPLVRPRFAERLDRLEAEHARILALGEEALARGRALREPQPHDLRELDAVVQLLVARIRRHEAEENELAFEVYWDETGQGD